MRLRIGLCGLGAACCSLGSAAVLHGAEGRNGAVWILPLALIWGTLAFVSALLARRSSWTGTGAPLLLGIVAVGALVRIPLIGTPPLLSDDVFRYLWEGMALSAGHNPFVEAPAVIDGLDDALRQRVNHNELTTLYPPLALGWFWMIHHLGGTVWVAQLAATAADLCTVAAITDISRRSGRGVWPGLLYAMHPLPALESAAGAHIDIIAISAAAIASGLWLRSKPSGAVLGALAATALKILPVALIPSLLRRTGTRGRVAMALGCGMVALMSLPVIAPIDDLGASFGVYASTWSFNGCLYTPLSTPLGWTCRPVLVAVGVGVGALTLWRDLDPIRTWFWIGTAFVILSPTVHPWYVLWALVPSLLCGSWGWSLAALPLLGSYSVLWTLADGGTWHEPGWLWAATWPLALTALLVSAFRERRAHSVNPPRHSPTRREREKAERPDTQRR
jgi:hypothetical protein